MVTRGDDGRGRRVVVLLFHAVEGRVRHMNVDIVDLHLGAGAEDDVRHGPVDL